MGFKDQMNVDLDVFFNIDEFAEKVNYYEGSVSVEVIAQFFEEESALGDSLIYKLVCRVEDLPNISKDGYFVINTEKYGVMDFNPDEQNLIMQVLLRKGV